MTTIDDLLKWDDNEREMDLDSGLKSLPVDKWLVLQARPEGDAGASAVDPPEPKYKRDWYQFRLGLRVIGGEEGVAPGNYTTVYHRFNIDSREQKGVPSPKLKAMINTFFGAGLPHNSPERLAESKRVLNEIIQKYSMDPAMKDVDDQLIYPDPAVFLAAVFAKALGDRQPMILARPYLRKSKPYQDENGETKMTKERVEVGQWTDFTPDTQDEKQVTVWGGTGAADGKTILF